MVHPQFGTGLFELRDMELPDACPGELLLRVMAWGITRHGRGKLALDVAGD